jgi:hypothetical protein
MKRVSQRSAEIRPWIFSGRSSFLPHAGKIDSYEFFCVGVMYSGEYDACAFDRMQLVARI